MIKKKVLADALICLLALIFATGFLFANENAALNGRIKPWLTTGGIQKAASILTLNSDISGKISIRDCNNELIAVLNKPFGKKIELVLEEGEYRIITVMEGDVYEVEIVLVEGDNFELNAEEFMKADMKDAKPLEEVVSPSKREALLGDGIKTHFHGGVSMKSTRICGEYAMLFGGNIGLTFNRNFSVGFAAYARAVTGPHDFDLDVDFDPGKPAYAGVTFGYSIAPNKPIHIKFGVLLGHGNYWYRNFYIVEPEIRVLLNLSQSISIGFGLSVPTTDRDKVGLDNPIFGFSFQFGR
ncbi:MAG: hypothetical protein JSV96_14670 [Candidatus Aminicenantes bacterium]|nr:MAG: hypothetical protein JSV96_14670 [Candidatus Aminicenantes bacterium]